MILQIWCGVADDVTAMWALAGRSGGDAGQRRRVLLVGVPVASLVFVAVDIVHCARTHTRAEEED